MNPRTLLALGTVAAATVLVPTTPATASVGTCTRWLHGSGTQQWGQSAWYDAATGGAIVSDPGSADVACWDSSITLSVFVMPGSVVTIGSVQGGALELDGGALTLASTTVDSQVSGLKITTADLDGPAGRTLTVAGDVTWQGAPSTINGKAGSGLAVHQTTGHAMTVGTYGNPGYTETLAAGSLTTDGDATITDTSLTTTGTSHLGVAGHLDPPGADLTDAATSSWTVGTLDAPLTGNTYGVGAAALTLTGETTFPGGHIISYGSLTLASGATLYAEGTETNPAPITVGSGATLAGTEQLSGPVTVQSGGRVDPGSGPTYAGDLTCYGGVTFQPGSTLHLDITSTSPSGVDHLVDPTSSGSSISLGSATVEAALTPGFSPDDRSHFTVVQGPGGVTGTPTITPAGVFTSSLSSTALTLTPTKAGPPVSLTMTAPATATSTQVVTLTATVTNGVDGDEVDFRDGTTDIATGTLSGTTATATAILGSRGTHHLTAHDGTAGSTAVDVLVRDLPGAPTLTASGGDGSVTATVGSPGDDGGSPVTGFDVTLAGATHHLTAPGSVTVTGLAAGFTYPVTATATTAAGTGPSASASATTAGTKAPGSGSTPPPPTNPTLAVPTITGLSPKPGTLTVAVTLPAVAGVTVTDLTVTCTGLSGQPTVAGTGAASPITVSGLVNNSTYSCTAVAHTSAGSTVASKAVTGRPGKLPSITLTTGKKTVKAGTRITFKGVASAAGQPVKRTKVTLTFRADKSSRRTVVATTTTDAKGAFHFSVVFKKKGAYQVRLVLGPAVVSNKELLVRRAV